MSKIDPSSYPTSKTAHLPWMPPSELELDPTSLRAAVLEAAERGARDHESVDRRDAEDDRRHCEAIVWAKVALASLPHLVEAAARAGQKTADVYFIDFHREVQQPCSHAHFATSGHIPLPEELKGGARFVHEACKLMCLEPQIKFWFQRHGDKGGYKIVIPVPSPH